MSTRSMIGRVVPHGNGKYGVEGRYHHFDGYPQGLGRTLFDLYHGHFAKNLPDMLKVLVDDHPAGWSNIMDADFTLEPGFVDSINGPSRYLFTSEGAIPNPEYVNRPVCYCHGERSEGEQLLSCRCEIGDTSGCNPLHIEYAYGIHEYGLWIWYTARANGEVSNSLTRDDGSTYDWTEPRYEHRYYRVVAWDEDPDWESIDREIRSLMDEAYDNTIEEDNYAVEH